MKKALYTFLTVAFLLASAVAQSQTVPTLGMGCKLSWDAYSDPVATGLKLYLTKDGVTQPFKLITITSTSITCKEAGITTVGTWRANLHGINSTTGEESGPSNGLTWIVKLIGSPQNFRVE